MLLTQKEMIEDHTKKHKCVLVGWTSTRFQRVVRSTLSAEAYQASDACDDIDWVRGCLAAIYDQDFELKNYAEHLPRRQGCEVTDCKSLYDLLTKEGTPSSTQEKRIAIDIAALTPLYRRPL